MSTPVKEETLEHGIAGAFYSSDGERYQPVMECTCGFSTGRQMDWEEAGAMLDEHLQKAIRGRTE